MTHIPHVINPQILLTKSGQGDGFEGHFLFGCWETWNPHWPLASVTFLSQEHNWLGEHDDSWWWLHNIIDPRYEHVGLMLACFIKSDPNISDNYLVQVLPYQNWLYTYEQNCKRALGNSGLLAFFNFCHALVLAFARLPSWPSLRHHSTAWYI